MEILDLVAKRSLQPVWYDSECHKLKKKLKHLSNYKHNNPSDEKTREAYHFLNKENKRFLRHKKWNHQNTQMEELINTNNSNKFWSKLMCWQISLHVTHLFQLTNYTIIFNACIQNLKPVLLNRSTWQNVSKSKIYQKHHKVN